MSQLSFDDLVHMSVQEAMSKLLGSEVWRAINFYFDVRAAAREPRSFEKLLNRLFGASSKVLQQVIGETLYKEGGVPERANGRELQDGYKWRKLSSRRRRT